MVSSKSPAQAPVRSLDQRMEALKRANDIRVRRAQLKLRLESTVDDEEELRITCIGERRAHLLDRGI